MTGWSAIPYCGPGATPGGVLAAWNFDPPLLLALALAAGLIAARGAFARHCDNERETLALGGAWLVGFALFVSPLCAMSAALFSVRVANHLALVALAAPLIAYGLGRARDFERAGPVMIAATGAHILAFWVWHAPAPYAFALSHDGGYWLMQASLLVTAIAFWRALMARRAQPFARFSVLTAFVAQMGLLGALIAFAPDPLYAPHFLTAAPWGLSALEDQQLGGLLMWVPGMIPYLALLMTGFARWMGEADARDARR